MTIRSVTQKIEWLEKRGVKPLDCPYKSKTLITTCWNITAKGITACDDCKRLHPRIPKEVKENRSERSNGVSIGQRGSIILNKRDC